MVRNLEAAPVTLKNGTPDAYRMVRDTAMHKLGIGTTHDMNSVVTGLFLPSLASRDYTLKEKVATWTGKSKAGVSILWDEMSAIDLAKQVTKLEIPIYFFHGIHDYTVSYPLAKAYFDAIDAPVKGFYTFDQSAHSPMFEEPDRMRQIMLTDIFHGTNDLADTK
jgi:pimeloyl-ACP methyl ester carboxylesterase